MIRSMTGFGSAEREWPDLQASVSLRSVNHRFLDVSLQAPRHCLSIEPSVRAQIQARVARGKLECALRLSGAGATSQNLRVQQDAVAPLVAQLRAMAAQHALDDRIRAVDLLRVPGLLEADAATSLAPELGERLLALSGEALERLVAMRAAEGRHLALELRELFERILAGAQRVERCWNEGREPRRVALLERLGALVRELGLDEPRLYQEVVRQTERNDVAEELQRLRSHVAQASELLESDQAAGKRLDFLAQELAREANTIGSKATAADVLREVVELKATIERVREQVQNVE